MKKTFLLTRPQEKLAKIAQALEQEGFTAIIEEIFLVEELSFAKQNLHLKNPQALIITSSNACSAIISSKFPSNIKIFAIGKKTAQSLLENGYQNIFYPKISSAQNLKKLVIKKLNPQDGLLLYFCGDCITLDFKKSLEPLGFTVEKILSYKINWHQNFSAKFLQEITETPINFILFYSQNSVKKFHQMAKHNNLLEYFSHSTLICFSEKIMVAAKNLGFKNCLPFNKFPLLKKFYK